MAETTERSISDDGFAVFSRTVLGVPTYCTLVPGDLPLFLVTVLDGISSGPVVVMFSEEIAEALRAALTGALDELQALRQGPPGSPLDGAS